MSKALIKKHSESVAHDTAGSLIADQLIKGVPSMLGWIAALSAYLGGQPLWSIILIGSGVFLFLTIAWVIISTRHQRRAKTSNELQSDLLSTQTLAIVGANQCPDQWLHDIARANRESLYQYVKIEDYGISSHALLDTAPYIDFSIKLLNLSVFSLSVDELIQGSIDLNKQHLSRDVKLHVGIERWRYAGEANLVIRQWLSKEEAVCVLNAMGDDDEFHFYHLKITIRGYKESYHVIPQQPSFLHTKVPAKLLREHYPKIKIEIQHSDTASLYEIPPGVEDFWKMECVGTVIKLKVHFVSHRTQPILIQQFRALIKVADRTYAANARKGDLYNKIQRRTGEIVPSLSGTAEKLKNLNSEGGPHLVENDQDFDGWLQFIFEGPPPTTLDGGDGLLKIVDVSGEEHTQEFTVIYDEFMRKGLN